MDTKNNTLNLISLPRDIYYKGRKLNGYYRRFGAEKFIDTIEIITGISIDKYFFVDMFAFIDIVNILGGININLDEDLVDPTYKVRNSGVWSTLYYKKGAHHLNGVETLRVARARHFTPAFSRDDRQQKIIGALVKKVSELNLASDFDKIYNIVKTIFSYLETNIILPDAFGLLSEAKTIKRINKSIVNTSNVLDQTYSTLYHQGLKIEDVDDDFDLGAWVLVPKENDWNRIHTFIDEKLEGKSDKYEILD